MWENGVDVKQISIVLSWHDTCPMVKDDGGIGGYEEGAHIGPKLLILAPQDIPDISGYQLGFGCQCVKAYNNENPVTNQKIL